MNSYDLLFRGSNNFKIIDNNGKRLWHYKKFLKKECRGFFHTADFNWKFSYVCTAHWSNAQRTFPNHLSDDVLLVSQDKKIGRNMKGPKVMHYTTYTLKATPSNKQKLAYRTSNKKLILAAALVLEKHLFTVEALWKANLPNKNELKNQRKHLWVHSYLFGTRRTNTYTRK